MIMFNKVLKDKIIKITNNFQFKLPTNTNRMFLNFKTKINSTKIVFFNKINF